MIHKLKNGITGRILYNAKKNKEWITRPFVWDNKCKVTDNYIIYFDTSPSVNNYRCATRPCHIMINEPRRVA